jgi:hypothetical protein
MAVPRTHASKEHTSGSIMKHQKLAHLSGGLQLDRRSRQNHFHYMATDRIDGSEGTCLQVNAAHKAGQRNRKIGAVKPRFRKLAISGEAKESGWIHVSGGSGSRRSPRRAKTLSFLNGLMILRCHPHVIPRRHTT